MEACDSHPNKHVQRVGDYLLGFPLPKNNLKALTSWIARKDKTDVFYVVRWDVNNVVIRQGSIQARVSTTGKSTESPNISILIRKSSVKTTGTNTPKKTETSALLDGKTLRGKTSSNFLSYSLENYGYVLEIANFLNVSLNDPKVFLENGQQPTVLPELVTAAGKEILIVKTDFCGKLNGGLVTFRIGTTDLRLAVAFQLFNSGNKFALGFVLATTPIDANLMQFLLNPNNWSTCMDHKYAGAKDGEQLIETRNIQASATMTEGMKALVKVAIKTY